MSYIKSINFTLGIPSLLPEWKKIFSKQYLFDDIIAGIIVALIAIPLSLAIALASGIPPGIGLITAIVAGIICALFGGTPLAVSGPAAAMTVLLADCVEKYGVQGLVIICLLTGIMQLISGIFGVGKLARYIPIPVIAGFTAGIGVIIIIGQLPRAFGLLPPPESHVTDVFKHLGQYIHDINVACFCLVVLTFAIIKIIPRFFSKISPILPAVAVTTALVYFLHLKNIALIGPIPQFLPKPHLTFPAHLPFYNLLLDAFMVYLLASLETLLSSSAVDKLSNGKKHDSNQELIGQGLGNIAVSFVNGMPVTGVIARSITNLRAGAKTRRAGIIHAIIILLSIYLIAPIISHIPIAALAGVLFAVAFSMINYKEFYLLWKIERFEAAIYALTFFTIIFVDLIAGIQIGMLAAGLIVLLKAAKTSLYISHDTNNNILRFSLSGSLTFLSTDKIAELEKSIEKAKSNQIIILDLSKVDNMDSSGAAAIVDLFKFSKTHKSEFYIKGLARRFETFFQLEEGKTLVEDHYLISETELKNKKLGSHFSARDQLIHGVQLFYEETRRNDKRLFEYLSVRQDPHTLFITCADSRIIPTSITNSDPGELFVIRNVGNYIPPYQSKELYGEVAALEFALTQLNITDIVICGHTNCGAINACSQNDLSSFPAKLGAWITMIKAQLNFQEVKKIDDFAQDNVINQVHNLKQYPLIQKKLDQKILKIHAWFFSFEQNMIYEWQPEEKNFKPVEKK